MPKSIHRPEYAVLIELLRETRRAAGLTQIDVSERLGRSQSFISDVERGVRRLDLVELLDLAHITGRSLVDLVTDFEIRLKQQGLAIKRAAKRG